MPKISSRARLACGLVPWAALWLDVIDQRHFEDVSNGESGWSLMSRMHQTCSGLFTVNKHISRRRQWHPTPVLLPENPVDRGAWWAAIYGVAQSQTRLKWLSSSSSNTFPYTTESNRQECEQGGLGCEIRYLDATGVSLPLRTRRRTISLNFHGEKESNSHDEGDFH